MLDTGIGNHPDFTNRILDFADFVNGKLGTYDDSGHGTHVAGCVGGSGYASRGRFCGIAANLQALYGKVLDLHGEGSIESMYKGLLWVLQNRIRYQIRVLNISVGIGSSSDKERMAELIGLLDSVWEQGIVVVCCGRKQWSGGRYHITAWKQP